MSNRQRIRYQNMTAEGRKNLNDKIRDGKRNGKSLSPETRAKQAISQRGRKAWNKGLKGVQVAWNKGKVMSASHKAKLKWSDERKAKASARLKGIRPTAAIEASRLAPRYRGPFSEEHRLKISLARKGKPHPHKGVPRSAETRAKISARKRGTLPHATSI